MSNTRGSRFSGQPFPFPGIKRKVNLLYKIVHRDIGWCIECNPTVYWPDDFRHLRIGFGFCHSTNLAENVSTLPPASRTVVFSPGTKPISTVLGFLYRTILKSFTHVILSEGLMRPRRSLLIVCDAITDQALRTSLRGNPHGGGPSIPNRRGVQ